MSEVFYRKFRPDQFSKIVGQDAAIAILRNSCVKEQFHHAYMFAGASGGGKTSCARILATAVNCENREKGSPVICGKCRSCVSIREDAAVDVREMDGSSQGGKDEINKVIESSMFSPSSMKKRIFIIDESHKLTSAAWASLLKPTEEPESHVIFIFCTSEYSQIPTTVASRFRRINFRPIPEPTIADYLSKLASHLKNNLKKDIPECDAEVYQQIAMMCGGNMRTALSYLESMILVADSGTHIDIGFARDFLGLVGRDVLYDLIDAIADKKTGLALDIMISLSETAPDYGQVCIEMGNIFRNVMHASAGVTGVIRASEMEMGRIVSVSKKIPVSRSCLFSGMFAEAIRAFEVNSDKRWVLESLVARLTE